MAVAAAVVAAVVADGMAVAAFDDGAVVTAAVDRIAARYRRMTDCACSADYPDLLIGSQQSGSARVASTSWRVLDSMLGRIRCNHETWTTWMNAADLCCSADSGLNKIDSAGRSAVAYDSDCNLLEQSHSRDAAVVTVVTVQARSAEHSFRRDLRFSRTYCNSAAY